MSTNCDSHHSIRTFVRIREQSGRRVVAGLTVAEKLAKHEGMVGFWMIARKTNILVHVEGNYVSKTGKR